MLMKHNGAAAVRINREPLTRFENARYSLATWLMRVAVYVVVPAKKRENVGLLFSLGAEAYAEERKRQDHTEFYARVGRGDQSLHRARGRADGKDGA